MKIKRLQDILTKTQLLFPNSDIDIEDGYLSIHLESTPTQDQIDSIPTAAYEEYNGLGGLIRNIRIWGQ